MRCNHAILARDLSEIFKRKKIHEMFQDTRDTNVPCPIVMSDRYIERVALKNKMVPFQFSGCLRQLSSHYFIAASIASIDLCIVGAFEDAHTGRKKQIRSVVDGSLAAKYDMTKQIIINTAVQATLYSKICCMATEFAIVVWEHIIQTGSSSTSQETCTPNVQHGKKGGGGGGGGGTPWAWHARVAFHIKKGDGRSEGLQTLQIM
ncbi:hypothetical protein ACJX0J_021162, partial [Zea mays]